MGTSLLVTASVTVLLREGKASGLSSEVRPSAELKTDTNVSSPVPWMWQAWAVVPIIGSQFQALGQAAVRSAQSDTLLCENNYLFLLLFLLHHPMPSPVLGSKEGGGM